MLRLADIQAAAQRIADGIYLSPCPASQPLSQLAGCRIHCKLDYLQRTGSFKERGARNALLQLTDSQRRAGVIAASAGNHAQALAYHGGLLGIPVTVVMPVTAPLMKVANCQAMGAQVIFGGDNFAQCVEKVHRLIEERGLTLVHGFDDPAIIAGQGTMGLEILQQVPQVDAVIVPIGGAGLIAGIALAIKSLKPGVKIIGVEPDNAASFSAACAAGHPVAFTVRSTLADGLAVSQVGQKSFEIAQNLVDKVVTVNEQQIALAVLRLIELEKSVCEGAGASPLAACLAGLLPELQGKTVVLPLSGGNIDTPVLGRIMERGLVADGRLCRLSALISDRPGGLAKFTTLLAQEGGSIRDVAHDRAFAGADIDRVMVHCLLETRDRDHMQRLRDALNHGGYEVRFHDLPSNGPASHGQAAIHRPVLG